jgi:protein O-mannosyl-transferase
MCVALLVSAILVTYWNSLSVPFQFDDLSILENLVSQQSSTLDTSGASQPAVQVAGRPIVRASFALNYALGGVDVTGYHVLNIAVHIACALLLFAIVLRTYVQWFAGEWKQGAVGVALTASLIWALHPLNTGTVTYVSARSESLMALCYLTMLLAGIRAHDSVRRSMWSVVAVVACALGMGCKETMVSAPLVMVLFDRAFAFTSLRQAFTARWKLYASLAATWVVLAALAWSAPRAESVGLSLGVSPWTYLLNQAEIIADYLRTALWPDRLVFAYGEPRAIALREVLPQSLLIVLLVAISLWAWNARPAIGILPVVFFVILAPTSTVVPIVTEAGAERRMYLPLAALVVLGVASSWAAWSRFRGQHAWARGTGTAGVVAIVATLSVSLGILTMRRNGEYASAEVLWRSTLERWPSAIAHRNLATVLRQTGRREEAVEHLRAVFADHPEARYLVGLELFEMGRFDESITELRTFIEGAPTSDGDAKANARLVVGRALAAAGRSAEAVQELARIVADRPNDMDAQLALADAQLAHQDFGAALNAYKRYLASAPRHVGAWTNLGIAAFSNGHVDEAIDAFRRGAELQSQNAKIHLNLASALAENGRIDEATMHAELATRLSPADAKARELYGHLLANQGRYAEAEHEFVAALQSDPGNQELREEIKRLQRGVRRR